MPRSPRLITVAIGLVPILLAGCFGVSSQSPSVESSASAAASAAASEPATSVGASAAPSEEDLGPFTCDLPLHLDATVGRANVLDVRTGTHAGYDRAVIEFSGGLPEVSLERATPPFLHDASGATLDVAGSSFLRLTLRGGTKQMDGGSSYTGPTDFDTGYPGLVHFIEAGAFEAQSTWYLGLSSEACVRVSALDGDEARLVIDIEH